MIPLLFPILADTIADPMDHDTVYVHEWGVVCFEELGPEVVGVRWEPFPFPDEPPYGYSVEAPVVWFHGSSCTGTFTVSTPEGWLTELYPRPDGTEGLPAPDIITEYFLPQITFAEWSIRLDGPEPSEEEPVPTYGALPFEWAMEYWRGVPSRWLYRESDGFVDRFIYYECGLPAGFDGLFKREGGSIVFDEGWSGEGLILASGEMPGMLPVHLEGEFETPAIAGFYPADPDSLRKIVSGWAEGMLKTEEIDALWNTWEGTLFAPPGKWLLFPLPSEVTERISAISFTPDDCWIEVVYERLFLGLIRIEG